VADGRMGTWMVILAVLVLAVGGGIQGARAREEVFAGSPTGDLDEMAPTAPQERGCAPYLGLQPPGRTPEPFAPGVISDAGERLHGAVAVSPDGRRICWSVLPPAILSVHCEDGVWTRPEVLPLPGAAVQAPAFSPDWSRLYYQAAAAGGAGGVDIWWVDARREEWTRAFNLGPPVNGPGLESQPTLTADGDLYFTGGMEGVEFGRGIYRALREAAGYSEPQALGPSINSPGIDYCPFITPDGATLLFASNRGHTGEELSLHIAFRTPDETWSDPVNLHPLIDFPNPARFPSLSPDGRHLFFLAEGRVWWVDAAALPSPAAR